MARDTRGFVLLCCFICFVSIRAHGLPAQSGEAIWNEPIDLSDSPGRISMRSAIVADSSGGVHVFWGDALEVNDPSPKAIFYRHRSDDSWSKPVDLFFSLAAGRTFAPSVAIDGKDILHLVWITEDMGSGGKLLYSQAPASQAGSAWGWATPIILSEEPVPSAQIVVHDEVLYVAYASANLPDVYLIKSVDGGNTWSQPVAVSRASGNMKADGLCIAIDSYGRIHGVWGEGEPGSNPPMVSVFYARSSDGGTSWSQPLEIDSTHKSKYWENFGPAAINVFVVGKEAVHIFWQGAPASQRYHQWSPDGGETWTVPQQISSDIRGLSGLAAMTVDSAGVLHLITTGHKWDTTGEGGVWYTFWDGDKWAEPILIDARVYLDQHWPSVVVTEGNRLHVVYEDHNKAEDGDKFEIWYIEGRVSAPYVQPRPLAIPTVTPSPMPTPTIESRPTETPWPTVRTSASDAGMSNPSYQVASPWYPIVLGILPVGILVAAILVVNTMRRGRR
jgi:hypothetical protein